MKPTFTMMIGLPGSGKSYFAEQLNANVHSSDAIREEILGDVNDQNNNDKVFKELHKRIKNDLISGIDCVYDATNISAKYRIAFIRELKNIDCKKVCVIMATTYEDCKIRILNRERVVPVEVLNRMYKNFVPPYYYEGWDEIKINYTNTCALYNYTLTKLFDPDTGIDNYNQNNSHHKLTLGAHCRKTAEYVHVHYPYDYLLYDAAIIHDEGKLFTASMLNGKGEVDGNCHYYQHHCVGAYNSLFYYLNEEYCEEDILYISNLIYFHMHPYMQWKDNDKNRDKYRKLLGEDMYLDIVHLHEGDVYAH